MREYIGDVKGEEHTPISRHYRAVHGKWNLLWLCEIEVAQKVPRGEGCLLCFVSFGQGDTRSKLCCLIQWKLFRELWRTCRTYCLHCLEGAFDCPLDLIVLILIHCI